MYQLPFFVRSASRNRRRSILTIASMGVSLCLLGLLISMYRGLFLSEAASPAAARRLVVRHRVSISQVMPISHEDRIAKVPCVVAATVWHWFGGVYKDTRNSGNFFARFAVQPEQLLKVRPEITLSPEARKAFVRNRTACIASNTLIAKFGWKPQERIVLTGDIWPANLELTLVGGYDEPDGAEVLFFNWDYLQESMPQGGYRNIVLSFLTLVDDPAHVPEVARAIDEAFANAPVPTRTESERDFIVSFVGFLGNLKLFLAAVCGAVTFTILLVCANTVAMTVRERIREMAIMRTLGFSPGEIFTMVLSEAGFLGALGGVLGGCLGWALSIWVGHLLAGGFPFPVLSVGMGLVLVAAGIAIAVSSAMVPAWFASRRSVVESLRYSG